MSFIGISELQSNANTGAKLTDLIRFSIQIPVVVQQGLTAQAIEMVAYFGKASGHGHEMKPGQITTEKGLFLKLLLTGQK